MQLRPVVWFSFWFREEAYAMWRANTAFGRDPVTGHLLAGGPPEEIDEDVQEAVRRNNLDLYTPFTEVGLVGSFFIRTN